MTGESVTGVTGVTVVHGMGFPETLTGLDQWVTWRYEDRDGKRTKVPINLRTGRWASTTDQSTWSDYETAAWLADRFHEGRLGFVFTPEARIVGVDLDHVIENGLIEPKAARIVEELSSYTEVSPSGTGLHVFIKADWHDTGRRRGGWLEIYSERRYFTMTGNHLDGTPLTVEERTEELEVIRQRELPTPPGTVTPVTPVTGPNLTDTDVIRQMVRLPRLLRLWRGDLSEFYGDESRADFVLLLMLSRYTRDPFQLDRLFRRSRLMRAKWDSPRGSETYGSLTIRRVLQRPLTGDAA